MICGDLMRLALAKGESQETVQSRTICCAILGAIAPIIEADEVEKSFLSRAMGLCQVWDRWSNPTLTQVEYLCRNL